MSRFDRDTAIPALPGGCIKKSQRPTSDYYNFDVFGVSCPISTIYPSLERPTPLLSNGKNTRSRRVGVAIWRKERMRTNRSFQWHHTSFNPPVYNMMRPDVMPLFSRAGSNIEFDLTENGEIKFLKESHCGTYTTRHTMSGDLGFSFLCQGNFSFSQILIFFYASG